MAEDGALVKWIPRPVYRVVAVSLIAMLVVFLVFSRRDAEPQVFHLPHNGQPQVIEQAVPGSRALLHSSYPLNKPNRSLVPGLPDLVVLSLDDKSAPLKVMTPAPREEQARLDELFLQEHLVPGLVPSIIHFVWCGQRWFEFKHYMTVIAAIKAISPDQVVIHYESLPVQDKLFYNQWWDDLKHDYPFLHLHPMDPRQVQVCTSESIAVRMNQIVEFLRYEGGIYVGENTWLHDFPVQRRKVDLDYSLEPNGLDGYLVLRKGMINETHSLENLRQSPKSITGACTTISQFFNSHRKADCLIVKGGRFDRFYPMDIWKLDNPFGNLARKIFYGTENILVPQPSYDTLVPNIGHMIWLGGGELDFVFYLSMLSMLYILNVDTLYLHGDQEPKGEYWENLKNNDRVKFITRPQPMRIYQGEIEWYFRALMSDLIRVDIMIKYGGIYGDTDAIWVKPLTHKDRGYDAVAAYDWVDWSYPYPDSVNFGLSYGKKNAPFWRIFRDSMRILHNDIHGFSGVMNPYKILEKYPHLLRIDPHLQVICYQYRCHPTWVDDYHNMTKDHVTMNSIPNWREDVNAFHWTHPNPPEYQNMSTLLSAKGVFAEIGQHVLRKAGLL